jgi:hypothetical protein
MPTCWVRLYLHFAQQLGQHPHSLCQHLHSASSSANVDKMFWVHLVLFGMHNGTFGPYWAAIDRTLFQLCNRRAAVYCMFFFQGSSLI